MIAIVLFLLALVLFFKFTRPLFLSKFPNKVEPPLVPGSLPIIGHLLSLRKDVHLKLIEWANVHGSLFTIYLGTEKTIIVDDPKVMREMFSLPEFSGRGDNAAFDYFTEGRCGISMSEGKSWEVQRRFAMKHLKNYGYGKGYAEGLAAGEINDVLDSLKLQVNKPMDFHGFFNMAAINSLWILTTGERLSGKDSVVVKYLLGTMASLNVILETGALYSKLIRRFFPQLSGWKDFVSSTDQLHDFYKRVMEDHRRNHDESNPRDMIDMYISEIKACKDQNSPFYKELGYKNLRAVIGDLFQGGSETTSTSLTWTLLFLTAHMEVQEKLQAEIDRVVGKLRKPSLSDRSKMPYAEAVISEILRKSSLLPLGLLHRALADTEFNGFMIRKGTTIIGNLYSALHNPKYWDEPNVFRPERFLTADGLELIKKPEAFAPFHVGKRACPGEQFAKDTLFLFTTSIFQTFKSIPDPNCPKLDLEANAGLVSNPKPFTVILQERN